MRTKFSIVATLCASFLNLLNHPLRLHRHTVTPGGIGGRLGTPKGVFGLGGNWLGLSTVLKEAWVDVHPRAVHLAGKGWVGGGGIPADSSGLFIPKLDLVGGDTDLWVWWWDDTAEVVYVGVVTFVGFWNLVAIAIHDDGSGVGTKWDGVDGSSEVW